VFVGVVERCGVQAQLAKCFDGGAVVVDGVGLPGGLALGIKLASNVHVARAKDQCAFTVGDGLGTDIQSLACGNHRSGFGAIEGFAVIEQGGRADAQTVAKDAACAYVVEGGGIDEGVLPINEAAVGQRTCGSQLRGFACDLRIGAVGDVGCTTLQVLTSLHVATVVDVGRHHDGVSIGNDVAAVVEVAGEVELKAAFGKDLPITAQALAVDDEGTVGNEHAIFVDDGQCGRCAGGRCARRWANNEVLQAQGLACTDEARVVVDLPRTEHNHVLSCADGTFVVLQFGGNDGDGLAFNAGLYGIFAGECVLVFDLLGSELGLGGGADQALCVVQRCGRLYALIAEAEDLALVGVGCAGGGDVQCAFAGDVTCVVVQLSGAHAKLALCKQSALACAFAFRTARVLHRLTVVQGLAVYRIH